MPKFYTSINLNNNELQNVALNPQPNVNYPTTAVNQKTGVIYFDTSGGGTNDRLVIRNAANSAWLSIPYSGSIVNADITNSTIQIGKIDTTSVTLSSVGTPTGSVSFGGYRITNVLIDSSSALTDAATKGYVDAAVAGLNVHAPVDVATTGSETYTAVGAAITQISGTTVDGYTAVATDRILIKSAPATISGSASGTASTDTTSKYNGVYAVTSVAGGNIAVQRASDYNGDVTGEVAAGDYFLILNGTVQKSFSYILSTTGTITVGTTALAFTQFSSVSSYTASNTTATGGPGGGLKLTGSAFAIDTDVTVDKTTAQTLTNKTFTDNVTYFQDNTTNSKKMQLELSGISTSTTRTLTVPDADGTIALTTSNVSSATTATTATNVTGGAAGSLIYQTGSGATSTLAIGSNTYILTSSGTAPQWSTPATVKSNIGATGKYSTTFTAASGSVQKVITNTGGSDNHGLGSTKNLIVQVAENSTGAVVYADVTIGATGTVTITFADVAASYGAYDITIIG
jgi:hypothetical protein